MAATSSPAVQRAPSATADNQAVSRSFGWPVLDYLGISLLVMLPLWRPGFILTMDAVFVPHYRFEVAPQLSMQPITTGLAILNLVLPAQIIEKLIFTAIFLLAGLGMHRLVEVQHQAIRYAAGFTAVFNPFVYDRMMYGQWTILLGYALLPWLLSSLRGAVTACVETSPWAALRVAGWWTAITIASLPMGIVAGAAVMLLAGCYLIFGPPTSRRFTLRLAAFMGLWFVLLNAYWIIPETIAPSAGTVRALHFSSTELAAFATQADPTWGSVLTVLGGYGFWAEGSTRFIDLRSSIPYWPLEAVAFMGLGAIAVWDVVRRTGRKGDAVQPAPTSSRATQFTAHHSQLATWVGFGLCVIVAGALAIGMGSPPTAAITQFLFAHGTLYHGLRETQKWVGLLMVAEIALAAHGLNLVVTRLQRLSRRSGQSLAAACLLAPVLFAPALFWGCAGQLHPVEYPASWFSANALLAHDRAHATSLFLPWHEYLRFPFTGRVIANPARYFFDVPVIQGDNMEMQAIGTDSVDPVTAAITRVLSSSRVDASQIAPALAHFHVKYVLLDRAADWRQYRYLDRAPHLRVIRRWPDLLLYRNLSWHG